MATATAQRTEQICDVKLRVRFTFADGSEGNTEYVKVMPTHYRKADAEGACCMPVVRLSLGIRTMVKVS